MRDQDKNRDPERARKRAVGDARCALKKLGLLDELAAATVALCRDEWTIQELHEAQEHAANVLEDIAGALNVTEADR